MAQIRTRRDRKTEGGARIILRGLGCGMALVTGPASVGPVVFSALMSRICLSAMLALAPLSAAAQSMQVPSGQPILPHDILWEAPFGQPTLVLRFLTPDIARDGVALSYDAVEADFDQICAQIAVPVADLTQSAVSHVLVVFMDRPVERGIPDAEATQYLAEFRLEDGRCMLEFF